LLPAPSPDNQTTDGAATTDNYSAQPQRTVLDIMNEMGMRTGALTSLVPAQQAAAEVEQATVDDGHPTVELESEMEAGAERLSQDDDDGDNDQLLN
jgi:hypothetical protein